MKTEIASIGGSPILSLNDIRQKAPSVFGKKKQAHLSEDYHQFPTSIVVEDLMKLGWMPVLAVELKIRKEKNAGFQKHMVKFRNPNVTITNEKGEIEMYPEILITNSHDGKNVFKFGAGIYRLVCENGLVIQSESFGDKKIRHKGYTFSVCREMVNEIVLELPNVLEQIGKMKEKSLTKPQQNDFAIGAQAIRWPELRGKKDVEERDLLEVERDEDKGDNLWNVFNRVQEKIINGGVYSIRDRKVRKVKNFTQVNKINIAMWELASSYL